MRSAVVARVLPASSEQPIDQLLSDITLAPLSLPFAKDRIDFVATVARELGRATRGRPEMQSLAFWMRRAELSRMANEFSARRDVDVRQVARGTVFHMPPANVDAMFAYSWVLALLTGNRNVVRLSSRISSQVEDILDAFAKVLPSFPDIAAGTAVLRYGHDDDVTAAISAISDVRVVWGGDATVQRMRAFPLAVHAREVSFPDRFSLAAIGTDSYLGLEETRRNRLAEDFFNDAYWFDQRGCSSPRLVVWVGVESDTSSLAASDFFARLRSIAEAKGYRPETATAIAKITQALQMMTEVEVQHLSWLDNAVTVLDTPEFPTVRGEFCGAGLFCSLTAGSLLEIAPHVRRADQTLSTFGISRTDLDDFVDQVRGAGIDRIVPIGHALQFERIWDGIDLLQEFTRKVIVRAGDC